MPELTDENVPEVEKTILSWDPFKQGYKELLDYVKQYWWKPDWGWQESPEFSHDVEKFLFSRWDDEHAGRYALSTGGHSDNEFLIGCLRRNFLFWSLSFINHRRGGHYILQLPVAEA